MKDGTFELGGLRIRTWRAIIGGDMPEGVKALARMPVPVTMPMPLSGISGNAGVVGGSGALGIGAAAGGVGAQQHAAHETERRAVRAAVALSARVQICKLFQILMNHLYTIYHLMHPIQISPYCPNLYY